MEAGFNKIAEAIKQALENNIENNVEDPTKRNKKTDKPPKVTSEQDNIEVE